MSSPQKAAHKCECGFGKTGYIDGDTDTIFCNSCDGVIDTLENLTIGDISELERIEQMNKKEASSHSANAQHYGHKEELDATGEDGMVWCNLCEELV